MGLELRLSNKCAWAYARTRFDSTTNYVSKTQCRVLTRDYVVRWNEVRDWRWIKERQNQNPNEYHERRKKKKIVDSEYTFILLLYFSFFFFILNLHFILCMLYVQCKHFLQRINCQNEVSIWVCILSLSLPLSFRFCAEHLQVPRRRGRHHSAGGVAILPRPDSFQSRGRGMEEGDRRSDPGGGGRVLRPCHRLPRLQPLRFYERNEEPVHSAPHLNLAWSVVGLEKVSCWCCFSLTHVKWRLYFLNAISSGRKQRQYRDVVLNLFTAMPPLGIWPSLHAPLHFWIKLLNLLILNLSLDHALVKRIGNIVWEIPPFPQGLTPPFEITGAHLGMRA